MHAGLRDGLWHADSLFADAEAAVFEADGDRPHIDRREMVRYRDLLAFLVRCQIRVRYAQAALGFGWAILEPVATMVVFSVVFGGLVGVSSEGQPYFAFAFVALVPWTYLPSATVQAITSLSENAPLLAKIFFPRIMLPLSAILARLVDFAVGFVVLLAVGKTPNAGAAMLPALVGVMVLATSGLGLFFSAICVQYRDVKQASEFGVRLLMYAAPVVYPASMAPNAWRPLYAVNPMVGVIEGLRSALLGSRAMPYGLIAIGAASAVAMAHGGLAYFRTKERLFADVA